MREFRRATFPASREERAAFVAKRRRVIRVAIPIDVHTVAATACGAFALATPLRVDHLLRLAVYEVLGTHAPQDKRDRSVRTTLEGLRDRKFVVDIDGRAYDRPEAVVLCSGAAQLRFFSTEPRRRSISAS